MSIHSRPIFFCKRKPSMSSRELETTLLASSAGLGLRRELLPELAVMDAGSVDFLELAPENWIGIGGRFAEQLKDLSQKFPITLHGLSLNIGGPSELDIELVKSIRDFIDRLRCPIYSEHLSYCGDHGHLYDLMPIPFRQDAIAYVADRVKQVQDILGQAIALENVSYYAAPGQQMPETEFVAAVLEQSECQLLLDVNNVYVNSINHRYDPIDFMRALPAERVRYMHVAGHYNEAEDLRVDTHGANVIDPVWELLRQAYQMFGVKPTLLERDFNFPPLPELLDEVAMIADIQATAAAGAPA